MSDRPEVLEAREGEVATVDEVAMVKSESVQLSSAPEETVPETAEQAEQAVPGEQEALAGQVARGGPLSTQTPWLAQ